MTLAHEIHRLMERLREIEEGLEPQSDPEGDTLASPSRSAADTNAFLTDLHQVADDLGFPAYATLKLELAYRRQAEHLAALHKGMADRQRQIRQLRTDLESLQERIQR